MTYESQLSQSLTIATYQLVSHPKLSVGCYNCMLGIGPDPPGRVWPHETTPFLRFKVELHPLAHAQYNISMT